MDVCVGLYRYIHISGEEDYVEPSDRSMQMHVLQHEDEGASSVRALRQYVLKGFTCNFIFLRK